MRLICGNCHHASLAAGKGDDIHFDIITSIHHNQMEPIPSIIVTSPNNHNVPIVDVPPKIRSKPRCSTRKLSTTHDPKEEEFNPFSGDCPLSWSTLSCFLFKEQSGPFVKDDAPLSWFPPSTNFSSSSSYVPPSKPLKKPPSSRNIDNLEDQINCICYYEDLINQIQACDDEPPIHWIHDHKQQQPQELSLVEILANRLREDVAADVPAKRPMGKKLKRFFSLPALKSRMSGSVRK